MVTRKNIPGHNFVTLLTAGYTVPMVVTTPWVIMYCHLMTLRQLQKSCIALPEGRQHKIADSKQQETCHLLFGLSIKYLSLLKCSLKLPTTPTWHSLTKHSERLTYRYLLLPVSLLTQFPTSSAAMYLTISFIAVASASKLCFEMTSSVAACNDVSNLVAESN